MKKNYSNSEKKDKKEALKDITEQLEKSIHEFMNGEKYKNFLSQMSKFHSYSLNNQILIAIQSLYVWSWHLNSATEIPSWILTAW